MIEIQIGANQIKKLSSEGLPNTKLLLQNQGRDVMYIFKSISAPTLSTPALNLFNWQSVEVDNSGGDIWVGSQQDGYLLVAESSEIGYPTVSLPSYMFTNAPEGYKRLRVEDGQTSLYSGKMFEVHRKITSPIVFKFTCTTPFLLHRQIISVSDGDIEMHAWHSSQVTESGTWTTTPVWRQNEQNDSYVRTSTLSQGGNIVVNTLELENYRDYARAKTSSSTAQRSTVDGRPSSERLHKPGTFYIQFTGTGVGSYYFNYEERP